MLVHVVTKKGKGYAPAEAASDKYHGVNAFDVVTGKQTKPKANAPAYTRCSPTRWSTRPRAIPRSSRSRPRCRRDRARQFGEAYPDRMFDVGIAEQHAVTFAAGLATEGLQAVLRDLLDLPAARL